MEYALVNQIKIAAQPGLKGKCPHCRAEVISKCGSKKIWHWAHLAVESCDPWFEPETQWHRDWKSAFGKNFSEIRVEKVGKYHIADVINESGIVFEFQNSPISPETIKAREDFYGERMIWVVNGFGFKKNFHIRDEDYTKNWQLTICDAFEAAKYYKDYERGILIENWKVKTDQVKNYLQQQNFEYLSELSSYYLPMAVGRNKELVANKLYSEIKELYEQQKTSNGFEKGEFEWEHARSSWQESKRPVFIDFGSDELFRVTKNIGQRYGEGIKIAKQKFLEKYAQVPIAIGM